MSNHLKIWRDTVLVEKLKGWETISPSENVKNTLSHDRIASEDQEFTLDGFYERFISWVVVDDQV